MEGDKDLYIERDKEEMFQVMEKESSYWYGYKFPEDLKAQIPWFTDPLWDHKVRKHKGWEYVVLRTSSGTWNGYVYIPEGHALHGVKLTCDGEYDHDLDQLKVHGGITYSDYWDSNWVIGFDTNHMFDHSPSDRHIDSEVHLKKSIKQYKPYAYVIKETKNLIKDIIKQYGGKI